MNVWKSICLCYLFSALAGCGWFYRDKSNYDNVNTACLSSLETARWVPAQPGSSTGQVHYSNLRLKILEESSMGVGAQGGLAWASEKINCGLETDKKHLETIFNFNAMMLSHGVLPPVLEEGSYTLNLADPTTIRVSDRTYRIVQQARFATTPPNWREYLHMTYTKPCLPDRTLLPRNDEEARIWRKGVHCGWEKGIEQAYNIFHQNLARLKRDYHGMVIYRKLLQEKMISQPFVARTELGVTGDGSDMRVNDQVLRIVALPKLQTNSKCWRAIVVKRDE